MYKNKNQSPKISPYIIRLVKDETVIGTYRVNISPSYLSAIERGVTDTTISTAKRLAKAFNISLQELFNL